MIPWWRWTLGSLALMLASGCGCIETPADRLRRIHIADELKEEILDTSPVVDLEAPATPEIVEATTWDRDRWKSRLDDLYEYLERDRCPEVLADAKTVLGYRPPPVVEMELFGLMASCFEKIGDLERASGYRDRFLEAHRKLLASRNFEIELETASRIRSAVDRMKEGQVGDVFRIEGEPPRVNVGIAERLGDASPGEVLSDTLPDGATIYFSKDPESLESDVRGPGREPLAVQRDPEFGYYFAIDEPPPP